MLHRFRRALSVLVVALAVVAIQGEQVQAQSLDAMRASGAVGERFDGYLVARDGSAQAFVNQVNAQRRNIYNQRAAAQGVPADQVGRVFAKETMGKAAPGTWLQKPDGDWMQK